jgi:hypothetical protein
MVEDHEVVEVEKETHFEAIGCLLSATSAIIDILL